MARALTGFVLRLKWPLLLVLIFITAVMGSAIQRLQIDPTTDLLFNKRSQEYKYYREFSVKFGSDHMIAAAMADPKLFSIDSLNKLKNITDDLSKTYPQVERVLSLANAMDIKHKFVGVKVVPALDEVFKGEKSPEEVKEDILANELYRNNLVSRDGKVANILIYLKPQKKDKGAGGVFIKELRKYLAAHQDGARKFYIAGAPVEQYDFIQAIRQDQFVFVPITTLFLIVTIWLIYRSFACMVLSMSIVFMTVIWSLGTISLLGQELNLVTSLLAPVIMIIAVVNSIHFMTLFFSVRFHHPTVHETVVVTMSQLGTPCFLAHFTIILGFIALLFDPVPAIQSFGIFAAIGTLYSYFVSMFLTPLLLPLLPYRVFGESDKGRNFFRGMVVKFLENLEFHWKWWILIGAVSVLIVSLLGIRKLEVDTNLIKQMKPDSPLAVSTRFIDENLTGVYVLGFVLRPLGKGSVIDYDVLSRIDRFKEFLESRPEIAKVNSITTLIKKINQARDGDIKSYKIPNDRGRLKTYFEGMARSGDPELWKLLTPDFKQIRLEARMKAVGTRRGAILEDTVRQYMEKELKNDFDYQLTGNIVLLGKMSRDLVFNQVKGFLFALASILISICVIFRSWKMALLAAIPNMLPILTIYGIMGYVGIELSSPTAMISSIVLGMVVDASIHFLYRFRMEFSHRHHYLQSLHHTYRRVGQSLVVSTLILTIGFSTSIFASFRPTIYFGILTGLAIFFSLLATLLLLPVCLVMLKPFGRERLFIRPSQIDTPSHV